MILITFATVVRIENGKNGLGKGVIDLKSDGWLGL